MCCGTEKDSTATLKGVPVGPVFVKGGAESVKDLRTRGKVTVTR